MAYGNALQPVFYVDDNLYIGNNEHLGSNLLLYHELFFGEGGERVDFNLTPSRFTSLDSDLTVPVSIPSSTYDLTGSINHYIAILNHNMQDIDFQIAPYDGNAVDWDNFTAIDIYSNNVLNGDFAYNGSSILTTEGTVGVDDNSYTIKTSGYNIGDVSVGTQYTMPHSPSLQLTMSIEMEGISKIKTSNGASVTNVNYTGNPLWRNNATISNGDVRIVKTNPFDMWSSTDDNVLRVDISGNIRNGRRIWSLNFQLLSDSDIFSANLGSSTHHDPSEDTSIYDSGDVGGNDNTFENNVLTDDSFISQVWNKTLGGGLPFIFQPDKNNNNEFFICKFKNDSLNITQTAFKTYDMSLSIEEAW